MIGLTIRGVSLHFFLSFLRNRGDRFYIPFYVTLMENILSNRFLHEKLKFSPGVL